MFMVQFPRRGPVASLGWVVFEISGWRGLNGHFVLSEIVPNLLFSESPFTTHFASNQSSRFGFPDNSQCICETYEFCDFIRRISELPFFEVPEVNAANNLIHKLRDECFQCCGRWCLRCSAHDHKHTAIHHAVNGISSFRRRRDCTDLRDPGARPGANYFRFSFRISTAELRPCRQTPIVLMTLSAHAATRGCLIGVDSCYSVAANG
jgi:hypothetical protein